MKLNINKKAVGSRIKQIRLNKGYTLESFGKLFGASKGNVQQWENGISLPNKERLATISKIADMTVNELLYGSIDEFLENNIDGLVENSDYPFKRINKYSLISSTKNHIDYINETTNTPISVNELDKVQNAFNKVLSIVIQDVLDKYNNVKSFMLDNTKIGEKVLHDYFFDKSDIFNKRNESTELKTYFKKYAYPLDRFIKFIESDDIENKIKFRSNLEDINELIEKEIDGYFLTMKKTLSTYSLSKLINVNINSDETLHSYIHYSTGSDYTILELKENKYNLENFNRVTGVFVENENTLYYLAHYKSIDRVPLIKDALYFILNHDNTYQITKITEIPNCKYIAPIIGKLE